MTTDDQNADSATANGPETAAAESAHADIADLGYEDARDQLGAIVARLESGQPSLEESMRLWERGEALATHCNTWLANAEQRIDAMTAERT